MGLAAAAPELQWDFKNAVVKDNGTTFQSTGSNRKAQLRAADFRAGAGVNGGGALICGPGKVHRASVGKLADAAADIEIVFKPDAPVTKKATLFGYQENTWGRAYLGIYITAKSQIGVLFQVNLADNKKKFSLESEPVEISADRFHTVRVTLESGGMGRIYLDGKLLAEDNGAYSFSDFTAPPVDQYHPLTQIGSTYFNCDVGEPFSGLIAGLTIRGTVGEVAEAAGDSGESRSDANILVRQTAAAPAIDGKFDDSCYKDLEWTAPFLVMGAMSQDINGLWVSADSKFQKTASRAAMFYHDNTLYAAIKAPFPAGMTPKAEQKTGENIWADDCVEFFLHPGGEFYYQVLVNAKGAWQVLKYTAEGNLPVPWQPEGIQAAATLNAGEFKVEIAVPFASIGETAPAAGTLWRGNFAREGATCGGLSSWAPVGTSFLASDRFGKLVFGSRRAYFEKQLSVLAERAAAFSGKDRNLAAELEKLKQSIATNGDKAAAWTSLHNQLAAAGNLIVQAVNSGKKQLVLGGDIWANFGPDRKVPFGANEIAEISLSAPRGARATGSFLVANITARPLMNNLIFKADKGSEKLDKLVRFREVGYIELNGGTMIPDPIFELPLGSMLRVAPGSTGIIWLDVDCRKLEAGTYSGVITLYPSYSGFEQKEIALKLNVSPVDISGVYVRNWTYAIRDPWTVQALKDYEFNCIIPIPHHYYPQYDQDGKAIFPRLDAQIHALLDNGVPLKEVFILFYPEFSLWADMKLPDGRWGKFMEPDWQKELAKRLVLLRDYLKSKYGISYDQYAFYPTDEPNGDPDDPKDKAYFAFAGGKFIKGVDPKFQLFTNPYKLTDGRQQRYFELFEILEPFYPQMNRELIKQYRESGREIWTYSIFEKSVSPARYRHLFWENLDGGFEGAATFYDMFATSGDAFNSYDSHDGGKVIADYAAAYRNTRLEQLTPSRRLEAWYLGYVDFKLAKFCRERIAEQKKQGLNTAAAEAELAEIIQLGYKPNGNMDEARAKLLSLGEKLIRR